MPPVSASPLGEIHREDQVLALVPGFNEIPGFIPEVRDVSLARRREVGLDIGTRGLKEVQVAAIVEQPSATG